MKALKVSHAGILKRRTPLLCGVAITILFVSPAHGQIDMSASNAIMEGHLSGARTGEMIANSMRLTEEARRIRVETELLQEKLANLRGNRKTAEPSNSEMVWAWIRLQRRIPDIHLYREDVTKLLEFFYGERTLLDERMEALYLFAKQMRTLKEIESSKTAVSK